MKPGLVLAGALLVVVSGSCGGDSDDDNARPEEPAPSRQEFIEQGDDLCRTSNRRAKHQNERAQATYKRAPDDETAMANLEPLFREGLEDERSDDRKFQRLTPPRGDEEQFQKMLEYRREATALLSRATEAIDRRDSEAVAALTKEQRHLGDRSRGFFQGYGFKECGSGKNEAD